MTLLQCVSLKKLKLLMCDFFIKYKEYGNIATITQMNKIKSNFFSITQNFFPKIFFEFLFKSELIPRTTYCFWLFLLNHTEFRNTPLLLFSILNTLENCFIGDVSIS